jgi:peptidoglycan LD-endopeptidase LytH
VTRAFRWLALGGVALLGLVLLVQNGGQQGANAAVLVAATSCGANVDDSATPNQPYTGPLPAPRAPVAVFVVPLSPQLQQDYVAAGQAVPQVPWPALAGIGDVESGQGRNLGPSSAGAVGFMQFLPSTWALADPNRPGHTFGDGGDPNDPAAAIPAAAHLLVASGANGTPEGLRAALFAYNHSGVYVDTVLSAAASYASGKPVAGAPPQMPPDTALSCVDQAHLAGAPGVSPTGCVSPVTHYVITGRYGESRPGHLHAGLDMAAPYGTPVYASCAGTVVYASPASGYGNYICIQHTATLTTCSGHEQAVYVHVGQQVPAGFVVGQVGGVGQGDATGPHDHFEVRTGLWGPTSDPVPWLQAQQLPVPLGGFAGGE